MRRFLSPLVIILILLAGWPLFHPPARAASETETALERISRTRTLRCAYILYPPEIIKDPNTGKLSGAVFDMTNRAAKHLGWTVAWVAEVGFTDAFEGFKTGKYDALCSGMWKSPARAHHGLFTLPTNYGVYYAYVRDDDRRFDSALSAINRKEVKIATIDGEYGEAVAKEAYSRATLYRLPQLISDISLVLESVATSKADIAFLQPSVAENYIRRNPGKIRMLAEPVRVMPAPALVLPQGEFQLQYLLDSAFEFMLNNGEIDGILRHYDPQRLSYRPIAKPYR